ncbi:L-threonylcarbamoyladenylate synthase [Parvularcula sp. IMCC14364]|uniref:L-threonylcarbamoyladenylate synthase n=1 Tax=Parvularcula sp. IMCC14364 TaxID=3067902 RepID=UPI0027407B5D|nr:L-threonylcarbamoyladenylate synthase [Parvularcula sp. IMCC14364]
MPYTPDTARETAKLLAQGGLAVVPTETVYGLAADATNDRAVARIFEAKGRPSFNPLIIHVDSVEMARLWAEVPPLAAKLAAAFWPGPLTLVLPRRSDTTLSHLVSAGLETVAVRFPKAEPARAILHHLGRPFAAPSANRSGRISPTRADHVAKTLHGKVDLILDDGPCIVGVESTIIKVEDDRLFLLRPGGIPIEDIETSLSVTLDQPDMTDIQAPGMLQSHYAPNAQLRLDADAPEVGELFLGFGPPSDGTVPTENLSEQADLTEAAANLFRLLHELDEPGRRIAVARIPECGLGLAINDRLRRAAAPRP